MSDILTPAELAALEAEVQKEIDKEAKEKTKASLKKELLKEARLARGLVEPQTEVLIDIPESGNEIRVNNFAYRQGHSYTVPLSVAVMLRDTMQRAWQHQAEVEGRSRDFFQRLRGTRMSGVSGSVQGVPFLKV
jgi:hypothetical protein